jgi:uncharacterized repeat protein (TIGR01451 family)
VRPFALCALAALFLLPEPGASDWSINGGTWAKRKQITIDHTKVSGSSALVNFPVLFASTDADFKSTANGGSVGKSDGTDIFFTDAGGTKLNHELDGYSATTGQVTAWVRVPSLSPTTDTVLYIYFGNASSPDQQNRAGTWDTNCTGVWHLGNATTLTATDSTASGNNGTLNGSPAAAAGQISGAASFNGSNSITGTSTLSGVSNATISLWVKQSSSGGSQYGAWVATTSGYGTGYFVGRDSASNSWQAFINGLKLSGTGLAYDTWQHVALTYASGVSGGFKIYLNGVLNASTTNTGAITTHTSYDFGTDRTYASQSVLDEVHMSNTVRSADWIRTEFNNESSPATFYSLGASQAGGAADLTISKTHSGNFTQGQTGATYTITVTNSGGAATSGTVTVTDSLPTGLTATSINGSGWTCTPPGGSCTRTDALAAGNSYPPLTLTVNVAGNAPASVTNTATVSGGGETNTTNDNASDPTTIEAGGAGWSINGGVWSKRKQVTIDHTKVSGSSALANFQVLFASTDADLRTTANGGYVGKSDGSDIFFTDSGGTKLSHELEAYSATTGQVTAWVRVPSVSPTTDAILYVYFGNASAPDQQNRTGTWDSSYTGVWHLGNGT